MTRFHPSARQKKEDEFGATQTHPHSLDFCANILKLITSRVSCNAHISVLRAGDQVGVYIFFNHRTPHKQLSQI